MSEKSPDFSRNSGYLDPLGEDETFHQTAIDMMRAVTGYLDERSFESEPPDFLAELAVLAEAGPNAGPTSDGTP